MQHYSSESPNEEALPAVSVIIISKNNRKLLEIAVASVAKVDYPKSKMHLVVLEETDTPVPLAGYVDYHTIPLEHRGFGYARNTALTYAKNSVIIFTDDDCTVEPSWIRALVAPLVLSPETSAVSGAIKVPPCGPIGACENILGFPGGGMRYFHRSKGNIVPHPTFSTCNCAIRRSAIDAAGGFNESMRYGGEDENISRHIAKTGRILYHPGAVVYHLPRDSVKGVFVWFVRRGFADVHHAFLDTHTSYSMSLFLRNAIVLRLLLVVLISYITRLGAALFFPVLLIHYGSILYKFRWSRAYYPSLRTFLLIPVVRSIMDAGRDVGILKGYFALQHHLAENRHAA